MTKEFLTLEALSRMTTERLLAYYKKVLTPKNGKYSWCRSGCFACVDDCQAREQAMALRPKVKELLDSRENVESKKRRK